MKAFEGKTLLITGGTGSFGNAILKRFLETELAEIRIFSRDEKKQEDMRINLSNSKVKFYIGDVRDRSSLDTALIGVDYVFHAAALKQVPSCEFYPMEAVRTNVLGTENVIDSCVQCGVKRLVVLSTDKAVYPINAMGMTKALAEKIMVARSRTIPDGGTVVCATRYGNVIASRGSVIPLFIKQIKTGQPLTVTDPQMTRFLMSLEDSVNLVLHAFQCAEQGDIFVQKTPASTVGGLAEALKTIFNADNPIRIIGTRHGEKLYESLISREEMLRAQDMGRYYRIASDTRELNYGMYFVDGEPELSMTEDYTSHNTERLTTQGVCDLLLKLDYIKKEIHD